MRLHNKSEMVNLILEALKREGVKCTPSLRSTSIIPSFHLVFLENPNDGDFILKLRASEDSIKISLWNSDYLFRFDLEDNVVRYISKSKKVRLMISMLERQKVIGPSMTCYQYAGLLFVNKNNQEWSLSIKGQESDVYFNSVTKALLTVNPFYIELQRSKDEPVEHRIRIEYLRGLRDDFWFSTLSKGLDDIIFFLDIYREINERLLSLNALSINGVFHPIL